MGNPNWSWGDVKTEAESLVPGKKYKFTIDAIQCEWIFHSWIGKDFEGPVEGT